MVSAMSTQGSLWQSPGAASYCPVGRGGFQKFYAIHRAGVEEVIQVIYATDFTQRITSCVNYDESTPCVSVQLSTQTQGDRGRRKLMLLASCHGSLECDIAL
jgi:hypothetical protein